MTRNASLCIIRTPTIDDLLHSAKRALEARDYNFAAEVAMSKWSGYDLSLVARRSLRDFGQNLDSIPASRWTYYAERYQEHRASNNLSQMHLRIEQDGERVIAEIRDYLQKHDSVMQVVAVKQPGGVRLPSVMILLFSLLWQSEYIGTK